MLAKALTRWMLLSLVFAGVVIRPGAALADDSAAPADTAAPPFFPQLEVTVPREPSVTRSDGKQVLVYELVLRNFEPQALDLQSLAVFDSRKKDAPPLSAFDSKQLAAMMTPVGAKPESSRAATTLPSGSSAVVFVWLSFDAGVQVPTALAHRVVASGHAFVTRAIGTRHDPVQVLSPPLQGGAWLAETGLSNDNGHRRGYVIQNGELSISRRYAFDWIQTQGGKLFDGDKGSNDAYFAYGEPLLAVADGTVVSVRQDIPENKPGRVPAVPLTAGTIAGNHVILDIGHGQYAHYMHLQRDGARVKAGDRVSRGQVIGLLGNSGSSFAPHLHFEVTTSRDVLAGEGVPYVFDAFQRLSGEGGPSGAHQNEMPLEKMLVDFR